MKRHLGKMNLLILATMLLCDNTALSATSECNLIKNSDERQYCYAMMNHSKLYCESIKNSDLRHKCRSL